MLETNSQTVPSKNLKWVGLAAIVVTFAWLGGMPEAQQPHLASAQQIFKWKDGKGQWRFSNLPPSGAATAKVKTSDTVPKSEGIEEKRDEGSGPPATGTPGVDPVRLPSKQLLVFPPTDMNKPLPEWIPVESFDTAEECERAKALQIADSITRTGGVDFGLLNSQCISLADFKPSKEADVIVTSTKLTRDPDGFSSPVLSGRVFNRGLATARSVVVKYQARDAAGTIYAEGEVPTNPRDLPPITFAEFRGRILEVGTRIVQTQAHWLKN